MNVLVGDRYDSSRPDYGGVWQSATIPTSLLNKHVIIIGGGPAGLFSACMFHTLGIPSITVLERYPSPTSPSSLSSSAPMVDPTRSYVFSLNPRGQVVVSHVPGLLQHLRQHTAVPEGYMFCSVPTSKNEPVVFTNPAVQLPNFKPGMLFYRPRLMIALREFAERYCGDSVKIIDGALVTDVVYENSNDSNNDHDVVVVRYKDDSNEQHEMRGDLIVGCDGVNSAVANSLRDPNKRGKLQSANGNGFDSTYLSSFAVGRRLKSIIVNEHILRHLDKIPADVTSTHWTSIKGIHFNMSVLPMLREDRDRLGGLMAAVTCTPDHRIWTLKSVSEGLDYFADNFPQLPIREHVSEYAMSNFIHGKYNEFRLISHIHSLGATITNTHHDESDSRSNDNDEEVGVLLFGDAAHVVPPDMGQGLNASLEDAAVFAQIAASCATDASLKEIIKKYDRIRIEDMKGLTQLCSFAGQMQDMSNPIKVWWRKFDRTLRVEGSRRFPDFIYPPSFAMTSKGWPYAVVRRRYRATTVRLIMLGTALIVGGIAAIVIVLIMVSGAFTVWRRNVGVPNEAI